ncbi:hypothetical protein ACJJTC_017103 [Scirpophaga incertulas]
MVGTMGSLSGEPLNYVAFRSPCLHAQSRDVAGVREAHWLTTHGPSLPAVAFGRIDCLLNSWWHDLLLSTVLSMLSDLAGEVESAPARINVIIWQHLLNNLLVKRPPSPLLPNYRIVRRRCPWE